jgi:hypothetical protein
VLLGVPVGVALLGAAMTPANGAPDARIASALNAIPLRPSWLHGKATRPSTCTGCPTVTFGSPATVTAITSPPEESNTISWTCHNGKPVSRSTLGWPESNAIRGSGARVHTNDTHLLQSAISSSCSPVLLLGLVHGRLRPHRNTTTAPGTSGSERQ